MDNKSTKSLRQSSGIILSSQVVKIGMQIFSIVVFSRLLPPSIFGLYAMVAIVITLAELLRDFGLSTTALATEELTNQNASNMFWLNVLQGVMAAVVVAALSPVCAWLFSQPLLSELQPVLALNLIINGFQIQFQVRLARFERTWALAISDISATFLGIVAGLAAFYLGFGFWALAVQSLATPAILAISRSSLAGWLPSLPRRKGNLSGMFAHSWRYGGGHLLAYFSRNVDNFMIGLLWGATSLGIYSRAYQLQAIPIFGALAPLTNVVLPGLVQKQKAGSSSFQAFLRLQFLVGLGSILLFCIFATLAPVVLPWILGQVWKDSANVFVVLALAGIIESLNYLNYWRFLAANQSQKYLLTNLLSAVFGVTNIVISSFSGILAVAAAVVVNQFVSWIIGSMLQRNFEKKHSADFIKQGLILIFLGGSALWVSFSIKAFLVRQAWSEAQALWLQITAILLYVLTMIILMAPMRSQVLSLLRLKRFTIQSRLER